MYFSSYTPSRKNRCWLKKIVILDIVVGIMRTMRTSMALWHPCNGPIATETTLKNIEFSYVRDPRHAW